MSGWSFGNIASIVSSAAKTGYAVAKDATIKAVETVQDPEFQMKVKEGAKTALETTKEVKVIYLQGAKYAYAQATDPENQAAAKEKLKATAESAKEVSER